jgi:hypothetical protein
MATSRPSCSKDERWTPKESELQIADVTPSRSQLPCRPHCRVEGAMVETTHLTELVVSDERPAPEL